MSQTQDHLRIIVIFHYVLGGIAALFSMFPLFYVVIGLLLVFTPETLNTEEDVPPPFFGWIFVATGSVFITIGLTFASGLIALGRNIQKRKNHLFCTVMAGVECMFMPFGTVLGVLTLVLLMKDEVKQMFSTTESVNAHLQS